MVKKILKYFKIQIFYEKSIKFKIFKVDIIPKNKKNLKSIKCFFQFQTHCHGSFEKKNFFFGSGSLKSHKNVIF